MKLYISLLTKLQEDRGAVAGEYAVLLVVVAVALVTALGLWVGDIAAALGAAGDVINP